MKNLFLVVCVAIMLCGCTTIPFGPSDEVLDARWVEKHKAEALEHLWAMRLDPLSYGGHISPMYKNLSWGRLVLKDIGTNQEEIASIRAKYDAIRNKAWANYQARVWREIFSENWPKNLELKHTYDAKEEFLVYAGDFKLKLASL